MLTGAGRTFTWNGENQPVQIAKTGTPTETYVYDGDNVRIKRTVASSPAVTSIYVGKVEYRGTQVISTYGGVASRTTTGTPTSSNRGTIVYMHSDHLGSVSMTTSATGTVAQTQEFDPWGAVKAGGITSVSYNYTGQRLDGTGLLFYNARYYDPQLARFTSADSIVPGSGTSLRVSFNENMEDTSSSSSSQDLNRYTYVLNNPLLYNDPSGHYTEVNNRDHRNEIADLKYNLSLLLLEIDNEGFRLNELLGAFISDLLAMITAFSATIVAAFETAMNSFSSTLKNDSDTVVPMLKAFNISLELMLETDSYMVIDFGLYAFNDRIYFEQNLWTGGNRNSEHATRKNRFVTDLSWKTANALQDSFGRVNEIDGTWERRRPPSPRPGPLPRCKEGDEEGKRRNTCS